MQVAAVARGCQSLVSVAAIINPEKHMRSFLPDSLPEDKKSLDQLILFHFTGMTASTSCRCSSS